MSEHAPVDYQTYFQVREMYKLKHKHGLLPETLSAIESHLENVHHLKKPQAFTEPDQNIWVGALSAHQAAVMRGEISESKLSEEPTPPGLDNRLKSLLRRFSLRRIFNR